MFYNKKSLTIRKQFRHNPIVKAQDNPEISEQETTLLEEKPVTKKKNSSKPQKETEEQ